MWFRTLFDSLKPKRSRTPSRQVRRAPLSRRPAAGRLTVEALEDRLVPASLAVSDVTIIEGNAGTQNAVVMVSLSSPSTKTVTVNYSTANGTALAGSDYQAASGKLTFAPGQTSKSILVPVIGDRLGELNEYIYVNLREARNATIADGRGVVTIVDDEPSIRISDVSAKEGSSGTTPFTFTVSLSAASDAPVSVNFTTADGTATTADSDYVVKSGTVTFGPGETSKTITIDVRGDATPEPEETFFVNLSGATGALIADGQGLATILDDELTISIDNVSAAEGSYYGDEPAEYGGFLPGTTPFTFTVSLSAASTEPVTVYFATADGTAKHTPAYNEDGSIDYYETWSLLTFAPGETTKTITVWVTADFWPEPNETFFVNLSGATGAFIADGQGIGTILDDDGWIPWSPPPSEGF